MIAWCLVLVLGIALSNLTAYAHTSSSLDATSVPYRVSITTSNFRISLLSASADDLGNPGHVVFHLQNGTALWYGISTQSTPAGINLVSTTSTDIVSSTFLGATPLLPPTQVLPTDAWNGVYHFESLQMSASFTSPGQQLQLTLSPTEPHAVALDVLTLLLNLLGQHATGTQIGLLENGLLPTIFTTASAMKDFQSLVQDYSRVLTNTQDKTQTLSYAYACALDISNLLSDSSEQATLADLLWLVQGKAVTRDSILHTITSFSQAQFGLAIEGFLKGQVAALAPLLPDTNAPTVLLQTVSNVTPTPSTTTATTIISSPGATMTSTPTGTSTVAPIVSPTSKAAPYPTLTVTPSTIQPTATRTR
jgi:hypothetical protein